MFLKRGWSLLKMKTVSRVLLIAIAVGIIYSTFDHSGDVRYWSEETAGNNPVGPGTQNYVYQDHGQQSTANNATKVQTRNKAERQKVTHIRFLKVHKAGSTTLQNLLFRFGLRYNLNIVVTSKQGPFLWNTKEILKLPSDQHYHIFALHTIFSKTLFENIIPSSDSVNIGIVRYPPDRLVSAAYYHRDVFNVRYLKMIPPDNFIHNLITYPDKYDKRPFSLTRNKMGEEFGFSRHIRKENRTLIDKYLHYLNTEFKLVLVMERFDESLVLMKRFLNWDTVDIIYLKANSHQHANIHLNNTEIQKLKNTSFLDFALYDYFADIFDKKVQQQGKDFKKEVTNFKQIVSDVTSFCSEKEKKTLQVNRNKWHVKFTVKKEECSLMKERELEFLKKLKMRHTELHQT